MEERITREMTIEDIFTKFPQKSQLLAQEITNAGLHCVGCSAATYETLEAGMLGHGMDEKKIDDLVEKLNKILEQEVDSSTITLTAKAAEKFRTILQEEGRPDAALRFGDRPAGCSGFEYTLDFSDAARESDETFHSEGIEIHVDKAQVERLKGSLIDYVDGLQGAGFKISNPNAQSSCGCGTSHGY